MRAHQKQQRHQQRQALRNEAPAGQCYQDDLADLDQADHHRLVEAVGEAAGGRREQEERQNEDAGRGGGHQLGVPACLLRETVRDEDHQRAAEHVVVQRADELRDEERQEAPRPQQAEIGGAHGKLLVVAAVRALHAAAARRSAWIESGPSRRP